MARNKKCAAVRVFTTLAASVVLGGCAMKGDVRDLQVEIRALAARQDSLLSELRAETLSTQDTLRTQTSEMFDFRGDINQSIRQIGQSLARLEALAGENQRGIAGVRDQLANMRRTPGPTAPGTLTDPAGPTGGGSEQLLPGGGGNAEGAFAAAMSQYDRGSLNTASMAFQEFVEQFPGHEREVQAKYYLADILEQQERPEDALEAFQQIGVLHPTDPRVPDAMFRAARLQHAMGDSDEAKLVLERIINTYSDAPIAMLARELLEEIG